MFITLIKNNLKEIPIVGIFEQTFCMSKNTSVLLGSHFETFISKKINSGQYSSASEVIRTALRLLETEEEKIAYLKNELELGEKSGIIKDFSPQKLLKSLHKKHL